MEARIVSANGVILDYNPVTDRFDDQGELGNPFAQSFMSCICVAGTEFLGVTQSGVLCKTIGKNTWVRVTKDLGGPFFCYAVFVSSDGTWFVGGMDPKLDGTNTSPVILRSTDQGATWSKYILPTGQDGVTPYKIIQDGSQLFAVGGRERYLDRGSCWAHTWKSVDDGVTWSLFEALTSGSYYWLDAIVLDTNLHVSAATLNTSNFCQFGSYVAFGYTLGSNHNVRYTTDFVTYFDYVINYIDPLAEGGNDVRYLFTHGTGLRAVTRNGEVYDIPNFSTASTFVVDLNLATVTFANVGVSRHAARIGDHVMLSMDSEWIVYYLGSSIPFNERGRTFYSNNACATVTQVSSSNSFIGLTKFGNYWAWIKEAPTKTIYYNTVISWTGASLLTVPDVVGAETYNSFTIAGFGQLTVSGSRLFVIPDREVHWDQQIKDYYGQPKDANNPVYLASISNLNTPDWELSPYPGSLSSHTLGYFVTPSGNQFFAESGCSRLSHWFAYYLGSTYYQYYYNHHYQYSFCTTNSHSTKTYRLPHENYTATAYPEYLMFMPFSGSFYANNKYYIYEAVYHTSIATRHHVLWESTNGIDFVAVFHTELPNFTLQSITFLGDVNYTWRHYTTRMVAGSDAIYCLTSMDSDSYGDIYRKLFTDSTFSLFSADLVELPTALDEDNNQLFVANRYGALTVLNKSTGVSLFYIAYVSSGTVTEWYPSIIVAIKEVAIYVCEPQYNSTNSANRVLYKWNGSTYVVTSVSRTGMVYTLYAFKRGGFIYEVNRNASTYLYKLNTTTNTWDLVKTFSNSLDHFIFYYEPVADVLYTPFGYSVDMTDLSETAFTAIVPLIGCGTSTGTQPASHLAVERQEDATYYASSTKVLNKISGGISENFYLENTNMRSLVKGPDNNYYSGTATDEWVRKTTAFLSIDLMPMNSLTSWGNYKNMKFVPLQGVNLREWNDGAGFQDPKGVAFTTNDFVTFSHHHFADLPLANVQYTWIRTSSLETAFYGNSAIWVVTTHGIYKTRDLVTWDLQLLDTPLVSQSPEYYGCVYTFTDTEFRTGTFSTPSQLLIYLIGSHLLRSLTWEKTSTYYLGLLTQMEPPIEVVGSGYSRQEVLIGDVHWTSGFSNLQRYVFQPFNANVVGWALFTEPFVEGGSSGVLLYRQPFPSTFFCTLGTPGLVLLPGDFNITIT